MNPMQTKIVALWSLAATTSAAGWATPSHAQVRQARAEAQIELLAEAADDNFGWSVASAGDVNGDGVSDLIVGAIYNDSAANNAGKAYVYRGGTTVSTGPLVTMTGMAADDHFGVSVAGAGDVNGDGYADVIVGARFNDLAANNAGAAFIYLGGPAMDGIADVVLRGEAGNDWFGNSVAGAGDVNGDGYADVVVGAPYNDRAAQNAGAAYVFYGGSSMDSVADVILVGEVRDDQFGWSVAGAGDVDGDGLGDVIVGARMHCVVTPACTGSLYARGRAYIYRGGRPMDPVADIVLSGAAANDWFGNTVAGVGDLNGDGKADVAVGAIYADPVVNGTSLSAAGTTTVFFGGSPMNSVPDAVLAGEQANSQSGWAIASAGDVDGDGRGDLWTTAHFYDDGSVRGAGKIYLYRGGTAIGPPARVTIAGEGQDVQLGQSVAAGRVLSMDGRRSAIAGQVYSRDVGIGSGKTFVLSPFCISVTLDRSLIRWTACRPFEGFNLYRASSMASLRSGSYGTCTAQNLVSGSTPLESSLPAAGDSFAYLVTGRTPGLEGALGFRSSGGLRPNTAPCP